MRLGIRSIWVVCLGLVAAYTGRSVGADDPPARQDAPPPLLTFEADVRPIFRASCWQCHGEKTLKGELDLRSLAGILKGGESGPVIVPGKPDESLLFAKVHDGEMPPSREGSIGRGGHEDDSPLDRERGQVDVRRDRPRRRS